MSYLARPVLADRPGGYVNPYESATVAFTGGTMDLGVGTLVERLRLTLAVDNVFDRPYVNDHSYHRDPY